MKNQNQLTQGSARSAVTSKSRNPHSILMCGFTTNNLKFDAQFEKMSAFSKMLGYDKFVQVEFDCLPIRTLPDQSRKSFLHQIIESNPKFTSIIFPKVSQFLKHKADIKENLQWLIRNKVQVYFQEENIPMFNSMFQLTTDFQSYLKK